MENVVVRDPVLTRAPRDVQRVNIAMTLQAVNLVMTDEEALKVDTPVNVASAAPSDARPYAGRMHTSGGRNDVPTP